MCVHACMLTFSNSVAASWSYCTSFPLSEEPCTSVLFPSIGRYVIARIRTPTYSTITMRGGTILHPERRHCDRKCVAPLRSCPSTFDALSILYTEHRFK